MNDNRNRLNIGVIGVGSMGKHHARVYNELPEANLVGVTDVDEDVATSVAADHNTGIFSRTGLLDRVDAVSVVVPTRFHFDIATTCLEAGVAPLVEKPVTETPSRGRELENRARDAGLPVQIGHIERFNPAVTTVAEIIDDLSVISMRAERLGPAPDREIQDSAVLDLMIHDLDVIRSLIGSEPREIHSAGVQDNRHATALLEFEDGVMASLTASRLTQRKVRTLEITAEECFVEVDYIDQSIDIYRESFPEYVQEGSGVRYRHESIIERPTVPNDEPLKVELASFVKSVREGSEPKVTIDDGVRALELAQAIEDLADGDSEQEVILTHE